MKKLRKTVDIHFYNHSFRFAQGTKRNETVAFELILFYN